MNRSHRHGAGSGCLGTMEVKSKVRGARAGRSGRPMGAGARGRHGGGLRSCPGAWDCGGAIVGFGGRRWWIINLLRREGRKVGALCLLLAQVGKRPVEHFISFFKSHCCSRMRVGAKIQPRRLSAAWCLKVWGNSSSWPMSKRCLEHPRSQHVTPFCVVQGFIEW